MKNFIPQNSGDIVEAPGFEGYKPIFSRKVPLVIRFADLIFPIFRIKPSKMNIVYLGVNRKIFYHGEPQKESQPTVLFAGRHEKNKGIEVLAAAIPRVAQKHPQTDKTLEIYRKAIREFRSHHPQERK